jgi:hypothetical protein
MTHAKLFDRVPSLNYREFAATASTAFLAGFGIGRFSHVGHVYIFLGFSLGYAVAWIIGRFKP